MQQLTLICLSPNLSATAGNSWLCFVCHQPYLQQLKTADFVLFVPKPVCNSWKQPTLFCLSPKLSATAEKSWLCSVCPQTCLQQLKTAHFIFNHQAYLQKLKTVDFVLLVTKLFCNSWKQLTLFCLSPNLSSTAENSWLSFVCHQPYLQQLKTADFVLFVPKPVCNSWKQLTLFFITKLIYKSWKQLTLFCLLPNLSAKAENSWLCFVCPQTYL